MDVSFDHAADEAPGIRTFYFRPSQPFHYIAGQFVELTLNHDKPDNRGSKRWFTLSSAPAESLLSITTRRSAKKGSSFKAALWALQPNSRLHMSQPMGDFVLPKDPSRPLIFIAGGIGVTPFNSIFKQLAADRQRRSIRFFYGVRSENEIIFQTSFARANIHATIIVKRPSDAWGGEQGQLDAAKIIGLEQQPPVADCLIYISGPEAMVEALATGLVRQGLKSNQIITDGFTGYAS